MKRKIIIGILILLIIIISIYGYSKNNILENITYQEIEKTDDNLGIVSVDKAITILDELRIEKKERALTAIDRKRYWIKENNLYNNEDKIYRIALIGTDSRGDNRGSADTIIVASINIDKKEISLASFMRDIQVRINGGYEKLNYSYLYGGGLGVLRVLNTHYELDIRDYVIVNMFDLRKLLDKVGPVNIDILPEHIEEINYRINEIATLQGNNNYTLINKPGIQELNGEQLVAYMRIRHTGLRDVDRTGRQREVIEKIISIMSKKNIFEILEIINESASLVTTSLSKSEIEKIAFDILPILKDIKIRSQVFPHGDLAYDDDINGDYYWISRDKDIFTKAVKEFMDY